MLAPGSLVFRMTEGPVDLTDYRNWWAWTPGACWRHLEGPGSGITRREDHPVVHVAFEDAAACGYELTPNGTHLANTWQGPFPSRNFETDGFTGTCPVRSLPANGYGLYEVCGNVWKWTTDWFVAKHEPADPAPPRGTRR